MFALKSLVWSFRRCGGGRDVPHGRLWRDALAILCTLLPLLASATTIAQPVKREIIALHDGRQENEPRDTRIHRFAEMPLNHLGYVVRYVDVRGRLPALVELERAAGVITWFTGHLEDPQRYLKWATGAAASGVRFIVLGETGADPFSKDLPLINEFLAHFGLWHTGEVIANTLGTRIATLDRALYAFERELDAVLPPFHLIVGRSSSVAPALALQPADRPIGAPAILAAIGPAGGFALEGYEWTVILSADRVQWLINPFSFFARALKTPRAPIPDVTTLSGRRIYFSHVDGDGWLNVSSVEPYRRSGTLSSTVMLKELIEAYPDLPVTIGLIAADLDPAEGGDRSGEEAARRILALPQVEAGSHTCTHPFKWSFFERYDRAAELSLIDGKTPLRAASFTRRAYEFVTGRDRDTASRYVASGEGLPRAYMRHPFEIGREVVGALERTAPYLPPGKQVRVYQWSGNAVPYEKAIDTTRNAGLRNINGGDSRFDATYPSIAYVSPISRTVGAQRQIYAVNANENVYTNDWTGPFFGFTALAETFRRTEAPRRLKGVNVYYHTYSAEKPASLLAVKSHLDYARHAPLAPITTSHYAALADSFFGVETTRISETSWRISNRGEIQTVRFDDADQLSIDLAGSNGILGHNRHAGALYVSLDPAHTDPIVALADARRPGNDTAPARRPSLVESRWLVRDLTWDGTCRFAFDAHGFGAGAFVWTAAPDTTYELTARRGAAILARAAATADGGGRLAITLDLAAIEPVRIEASCALARKAENRDAEAGG